MHAAWEGKRYKEGVVEIAGPEMTYAKFIQEGHGTRFFPQKFEGGRKILETGRGCRLETVDRSFLKPPTHRMTMDMLMRITGKWIVLISPKP